MLFTKRNHPETFTASAHKQSLTVTHKQFSRCVQCTSFIFIIVKEWIVNQLGFKHTALYSCALILKHKAVMTSMFDDIRWPPTLTSCCCLICEWVVQHGLISKTIPLKWNEGLYGVQDHISISFKQARQPASSANPTKVIHTNNTSPVFVNLSANLI